MKILQKKKVRKNGNVDFLDCSDPRGKKIPGKNGQKDVKQNPRIIDGNNSEKSARVKCFEIIGRVANVQQNSADQESGKHEKQIDSGPAQAKPVAVQKARGANPRNSKVVRHQDQQDRHAAETVKFCYASLRNALRHEDSQ